MNPVGSPICLFPDWPVPSNVGAIVTCRAGGFSSVPFASLNLALHVGDDPESVLQNRQLLAQQLEPTLQWQWLEQVHGSTVQRVSTAQAAITADGLISATPGLACCVLTADCLPVLLAAADGSEVGIAHAGWRGMVKGIIANTVSGMSASAEHLVAWLGPAIGPCHFEVGPEVQEAFQQSWGNSIAASAIADCFQSIPGKQKFMADLFALARLQLDSLGINIVSGGGECTYCQQEKFYSFRRSGQTGRLLSMIYLK